ncbi:GGDEF domain-containing protein [Paenibacillus sp. HN-1]|uniref:GGDEF domain-containing protein n=1 Tax=Paenibacillus TaxID=44249 RepID=UPI001CA9516A|nr:MULTISPECIES: GGDEF domain-containing protein [Paenibacillus]MBY9077913.1 GGDEF domain-containing protein [Paenibacillus sp. CGMCC 1.18879]MBY9088131.1 GGDEF domain-containing protein [Paenibacillus sinensis]
MKEAQSRPEKKLLAVILLLLALGAGRYSLPMLVGLQFSFQSLFTILAIRLIGRRAGLLISVVVLAAQWGIWHGPVTDALLFLEIAFLCFYKRKNPGSFLLRDLMYWAFLGAPILYILTVIQGQPSMTESILLITMPTLNGITNALLSELLLIYVLPNLLYSKRGKKEKEDIPLQGLLFHVSVSGIIFAFILILVFTGQYLDKAMHQRVFQFASSLSSNVRDELAGWTDEDDRMLSLHADLQAGRLEQLVLNKNSGNARILITDQDGYVYADNRMKGTGKRWLWPEGEFYRYNEKMWLSLPSGDHLYELARWNDALYILDDPIKSRNNLHVLILVPAFDYLQDTKSVYSLILGLSLISILVIMLGNVVLGRVIQRAMAGLVRATSGLPGRLSSGGTVDVTKGRIFEFNRLIDNFREMSVKLGSMFREGEEMNGLLQMQAEKVKHSEQLFRQLAFSDNLTNLPNRLYFSSYLDHLQSELGNGNGASQVTMLFLDLDKFKSINDTFGHEAGDEVLIHAAQVLSRSCGTGSVCRIAGDEFVVILEEADCSQAEEIAEAIIAGIREPFVLGERELFMYTSIGIASFPGDTSDLSKLVQLADRAMYKAKQQGGGGYAWYSAACREVREQ